MAGGRIKIVGKETDPQDALDALLLPDSLLTIIDSASDTVPRRKANTNFILILNHLSKRLYELVSLTSALAHPSFPDSLFKYHLLTDTQLDDLARHYHQVWPPTPETFRYPQPIPAWIGTPDEHMVDIETKRRRIGRFIGLGGCKSPSSSETCFGTKPATATATDDFHYDDKDSGIEIMMEKEWEEALRRAKNEDGFNVVSPSKAGGY